MAIFGSDIPFAEHCGIEALGVFDGATRLRVAPAAHLENNLGMVHGGLTCTLLDIALATAARTTIGRPVMTLDMQVSFIGPGRGALLAEGRVVRGGRSVFFCAGEVRRESDGALVATATGIFMPVRESASAEGPAQNSV